MSKFWARHDDSSNSDEDDDVDEIDVRSLGDRDATSSSTEGCEVNHEDAGDKDDDAEHGFRQMAINRVARHDGNKSSSCHTNTNQHSIDKGNCFAHESMFVDPDEAWQQLKATQAFLPPPTTTPSTITSCRNTENNTAADSLRIVCMSDTHSRHRDIAVPKGDILIHTGDFTKSGEVGIIQDLSNMLHELSSKSSRGADGFDQIIVIAGNHDVTLQAGHYDEYWKTYHHRRPFDTQEAKAALQNFTYLEDSMCHIGKDSIVYGSPWSLPYGNWAFALHASGGTDNATTSSSSLKKAACEVWSQIPTDTDVLLTHGPPLGRGDRVINHKRKHVGCVELLHQVQQRIQPRLHVYGHIHEDYGYSYDGHTLFVNASNLDHRYRPINPCIVIDLPLDKNKPALVVKPQCRVYSFQDWVEKGHDEKYAELADFMRKSTARVTLCGNDLLKEDAHVKIVDQLQMHRHDEACEQVQLALKHIYAESFD